MQNKMHESKNVFVHSSSRWSYKKIFKLYKEDLQ